MLMYFGYLICKDRDCLLGFSRSGLDPYMAEDPPM